MDGVEPTEPRISALGVYGFDTVTIGYNRLTDLWQALRRKTECVLRGQ